MNVASWPKYTTTRPAASFDPECWGIKESHLCLPFLIRLLSLDSYKHSPSNLQSSQKMSSTEIYDLFCCGFGPAGLAVAVGLHDNPDTQQVKAHFIEKQERFGWHPGMTIPGYKMQVSFLKDLVTMRDPTSRFSFLNYLKEKGRLEEFSNLNQWMPLRVEYNDYLSWAADYFADRVTYSSEAVAVEPYYTKEGGDNIEILKVTSKHPVTGETKSWLTRHLVIATGAQPKMPAMYPKSDRIIHSSRYLYTEIPKDVKRVGVIGGGQSSAEIFKHMSTRFPEDEVKLIIRHTAIRPADQSAYINELYNPGGVDRYFNLPEERQLELLNEMKNTAVSVVHQTTLFDLYTHKYEQLAMGMGHRHEIVPNMKVDAVEAHDNGVTVTCMDRITGKEVKYEFDILFYGVGYERRAQVNLLQPNFEKALFPMAVRRDYSLVSRDPKFKPTVYLQGLTEGAHGIPDAALSVMSVRGYEVGQSVLKRLAGEPYDPNGKINTVKVGGARDDSLIWGF